MSIFAELKSKLWLDWEMCRNNALFKLPIFVSFVFFQANVKVPNILIMARGKKIELFTKSTDC